MGGLYRTHWSWENFFIGEEIEAGVHVYLKGGTDSELSWREERATRKSKSLGV
jgi:hypothetical protein